MLHDQTQQRTVCLPMPMLTLFDVLQCVGAAAGAVVGYRLGTGIGATVGGVLGSIVGVVVGWMVGGMPFALSFWFLRRSLRRASVADLRSRLGQDYFVSHLIIAELVTR